MVRGANGEVQKVHFGMTQSGIPGLFTGNTLAWPLTMTVERLRELQNDKEQAQRFAKNCGFELDY